MSYNSYFCGQVNVKSQKGKISPHKKAKYGPIRLDTAHTIESWQLDFIPMSSGLKSEKQL